MEINATETDEHEEIIRYILNFLNPDIENESYIIIKNFEPCEGGFTGHSTKLQIKDMHTKSTIFKGCKHFCDLQDNNPLKKVKGDTVIDEFNLSNQIFR